MNEDTWKKYGGCYDCIMKYSSCYQNLLDKSLFYLKGCRRILDFGCGTGNLLLKLDETSEKYGIDNNISIIKIAEDKLLNRANLIPWQKFDESKYKNFFDGIACLNVLCFVEKPDSLIGSFYDMLQNMGKLVISGPKTRFNTEILKRQLYSDLKKYRKSKKLDAELKIFEECNKKLTLTVKNTYNDYQIKSALSKSGFVIDYFDNVYLKQNYFAVAKKK